MMSRLILRSAIGMLAAALVSTSDARAQLLVPRNFVPLDKNSVPALVVAEFRPLDHDSICKAGQADDDDCYTQKDVADYPDRIIAAVPSNCRPTGKLVSLQNCDVVITEIHNKQRRTRQCLVYLSWDSMMRPVSAHYIWIVSDGPQDNPPESGRRMPLWASIPDVAVYCR